MKILNLLVLIFFTHFLFAQPNKERYYTDIHGELKYESSDGKVAKMSENIFNDWIYSDNSGNKFTYTKKYLDKVLKTNNDRFRNGLFRDLVNVYRNSNNFSEKYDIDIFDNLLYESNDGYKASFGQDVFDNKIFKDSNRNEFKTSKIFTDMFFLEYKPQDRRWKDKYNEADWFRELIFENVNNKNIKEEYSVDIFGNFNYKNNVVGSASLKKDIFDVYTYSDSKGNKIAMSKEILLDEIDRNSNLQTIFLRMIRRYLLID